MSTTQRSSIEDDSIGENSSERAHSREANNSAPRCSIFHVEDGRPPKIVDPGWGASLSTNLGVGFVSARPGKSSFAGVETAPPLKRILLACPGRQRPLLPRRHSSDTRRFLGFCAWRNLAGTRVCAGGGPRSMTRLSRHPPTYRPVRFPFGSNGSALRFPVT